MSNIFSRMDTPQDRFREHALLVGDTQPLVVRAEATRDNSELYPEHIAFASLETRIAWAKTQIPAALGSSDPNLDPK